MRLRILTSVSVLALFFGMQAAVAEASNAAVKNKTSVGVNAQENKNLIEDMKDALGKTKDRIVNSTEEAADAVKEKYNEVKYTQFQNDDDKGVEATISASATAEGMLGEPVNNASGERIGTLKDIILNDKGEAVLAVISDSELIDLGAKEVAFDYALVARREKDGDVIMPLTEESINNAKAFSYNVSDASDKTRSIPANGYSIEKLLGTDVLGPDNQTVGNVDNIIFKEGRADLVIVGFDKILNMGGKKAALAFHDLQLVRKNETDANFQLTASQSAQFEAFKQNVSN